MATTRATAVKLLASLSIIGSSAAVAGLGTFGDFSSTTSSSQTVSSGTVVVSLGATGTANRLSVAASGLVPGDTVQRAVDLNNSGTQAFAAITLTTSATTSSVLDTDSTNGLKMVIDACSQAWTEATAGTGYTYTCGGTTSSVLASRAVIGSNLALSNLALSSGASNHLRVTLTLPSTADDTFQGKSSTVLYTFNATQRTRTDQ